MSGQLLVGGEEAAMDRAFADGDTFDMFAVTMTGGRLKR
jgi:hypothetical protein